jgi:hypothetical protein
MTDIDFMSPQSGRIIKENNEKINVADILDSVHDAVNGVLKTLSMANDSEINVSNILDSVHDAVNGVLKTSSMANDSEINVSNILDSVHDAVNGVLKTSSMANDSEINVSNILDSVHDAVNGVLKTSSMANDSEINVSNILDSVHDAVNGVLKTSSTTLEQKVESIKNIIVGGHGSKRINTTGNVTPDTGFVFVAIQVVVDTIFNTLTGNMTNSTGLSLSKNTIIYGRFTIVDLTSGDVIAYQGV